jgi:hypothetical protein
VQLARKDRNSKLGKFQCHCEGEFGGGEILQLAYIYAHVLGTWKSSLLFLVKSQIFDWIYINVKILTHATSARNYTRSNREK